MVGDAAGGAHHCRRKHNNFDVGRGWVQISVLVSSCIRLFNQLLHIHPFNVYNRIVLVLFFLWRAHILPRPLACHTHCSSRANKSRSSGAHKPRAKHSKAGRSRANKTFESSKSRVNKIHRPHFERQLTSHGWPFKIVCRDDALHRTLITWSNKCRKLMDFYYPIKIMHFTLVETNTCWLTIGFSFFAVFA